MGVGFARAAPARSPARPPLSISLRGGRPGNASSRDKSGERAGTAPDIADSGFTLIEVVVALALFALIAAAGAAMVTTVLDAQRHTAGRLDRLADLQRTMAVVTRDLTEITDAPLTGSGTGITFARHAGDDELAVGYRLTGTRLERVGGGRAALLLGSVTTVRWRYFALDGGWQDHWPASEAQAQTWPAAVAVDLDLGGPPPNGHLRRVVDLPVRPLPPGSAIGNTVRLPGAPP